MRPFIGRLVVAACILGVAFGVRAVFGVDPLGYPRIWILVPVGIILLVRWLRREERPLNQLDELQDAATADGAPAADSRER
jgi:hypothetical protein